MRERWLCCVLVSMFVAIGCKQKPSKTPPQRSSSSKSSGSVGAKVAAKVPSLRYRTYSIDQNVKPHPKIEKLIAPFRIRLKESMGQVLTKSSVHLVRGRPTSNFGSLITAASLARIRAFEAKAAVFVMNVGGIRNELAPGKITLGNVYECLPFDNALVWLKVKSTHIKHLANIIAKRKGEPVSGLSFVIDKASGKATQIRVAGKPLVKGRIYVLGTIDYLAETGYLKPALKGVAINRTGILLRDVMIDAFKKPGWQRWAVKDNRISYKK